MECARNAGGDNAAIVHCLTGHAGSEEALAMLIAAQRGTGDRAGAMRNMHTYVTRYATGAHVNDYTRYLENNE